MRVDCALLCDSVTVREGLLHILGGGITRINRPQYPAPFGAGLALRIMLHPTEAATRHQVRMILQSTDGDAVAEMRAEFGVNQPTGALPGEELAIALAIVMTDLPIPEAGPYSFELLIDGIHQTSVPFVAVTAQAGSEEEGSL